MTYQTDANGQPVSKILVETCTDIADELYLGAVVDRSSRRIVFMASTEGGVEIEKVLKRRLRRSSRQRLTVVGPQPFRARIGVQARIAGAANQAVCKYFQRLSESLKIKT